MVLRKMFKVRKIGHWIMHKLPLIYSPEYDPNLYKYSSEWVHEGWAQLLTYWIVAGSNWECTFNELNRRQSRPYKIYKRFIHIGKGKVIDSLIKLRGLRFPATLESWEFFLR